jgi:hypothetical protein
MIFALRHAGERRYLRPGLVPTFVGTTKAVVRKTIGSRGARVAVEYDGFSRRARRMLRWRPAGQRA